MRTAGDASPAQHDLQVRRQNDLATETTERTAGDAALRTDLGTAADPAAADGSAYARIRSLQSGLPKREAAVSRIDGTLCQP